ncbi:hypothetical protein LCGC14_2124380 [marine sediment metagenome]|uniref:Uncharacterized protein n=1 Tax=marine sediment metagenome TaxID=412755 RepID=A0A0F9E389_9ZZZZ
MKIAEGDSVFKALHRFVAEVDPPVIPPGKSRTVDVAIKGVEVGDAVMAIPPPYLGEGIGFVGCRVTADDIVTIGLDNHNKNATQPVTDSWFFIIVPK